MPPKGRNKPTPMVVFMNDLRDEMEMKHKKKFHIPFDEQLYNLCKPIYDALDEEQKQYYKDKAKAEWTGIRDDKNKKLTSNGIPVAVIERQEMELRKRKKVEFMEIEKQFNFDNETILPMEIVVIHVNWFCKVNDNHFVPAEASLARFSLKEGLIDTYHCFPYFDFPAGTKGDSKTHSERTHQIPVFGFTERLKQWPVIFQDIMKFLAKNNQGSLPEGACYPIYTMDDDVNDITSRNAVRCFLNDIVSAATYDDTQRDNPHEKFFKLYDLSKLMAELKRKDTRTNPALVQLIDEQLMSILLRKDSYLQSPDIACKWHDEHDQIPKCSKSRCISWVYTVCDQLQFMGYPMLPGKHMPHNVQVEEEARVSSYFGDDDDDEHREFDGSDNADSEFDEYGSVASNYYDREFPARMDNLNLGREPY